MNEGPRPWTDLASLGAGLASVAWVGVSLLPGGFPAWPSVSLGLIGVGLAWPSGRALPRAVGVFLSLLGIAVGAAQIAGLYWVGAQAGH